jgi:hypothetical protein
MRGVNLRRRMLLRNGSLRHYKAVTGATLLLGALGKVETMKRH